MNDEPSPKPNRGRPRLNPDRPLTNREKRRRYTGAKPREIMFALFDPRLVLPDIMGIVHRCALVGQVVGCSRQQVESDRPGLKAVPIGSLRAKERRWLD